MVCLLDVYTWGENLQPRIQGFMAVTNIDWLRYMIINKLLLDSIKLLLGYCLNLTSELNSTKNILYQKM